MTFFANGEAHSMQFKISFQQIEYFLTIAETLSFTEAAQNLYISQPALSKQINVLEKELGFPLFSRDRRHVALTPEGAMLYRDWKQINREMESSIYNAQKLRKNARGRLNIGCTDSFDYSDFLPEIIRKYSQEYPDIEIDTPSFAFKPLRERFLKDKMDIILIPSFELEGLEDICWMKIEDIPLSFVIPRINPLSKKDTITFQDLKEEKFVLISPNESPAGALRTQAACLRCGLRITNARYVPNAASQETAVKNGLGIALCNARQFENDKKHVRIYPVPITIDDSFMVAAWKKERPNISLDLFINMLQDSFPNPIHG